MDKEFSDKIIVVTGASRGIGKTIATYFGDSGAKVMCLATKKENCDGVVDHIISSGGKAFAFGCHVDDITQVKRTFE